MRKRECEGEVGDRGGGEREGEGKGEGVRESKKGGEGGEKEKSKRGGEGGEKEKSKGGGEGDRIWTRFGNIIKLRNTTALATQTRSRQGEEERGRESGMEGRVNMKEDNDNL